MPATESNPSVHVFDDPEQVAREAAGLFVRLSIEAVSERGSFSVALSGGTTPRRIYELLASDDYRTQVTWANVHLFFGDQRTVAPHHPDSNYRMANEALLSLVPIPAKNVHRIDGVGDAAANASQYESELREFFGDASWPRLDLVMLGMGDVGHKASLFPGTTALAEGRALAVAYLVEQINT